MAGASSMKTFEGNEQIMTKWENKMPVSLNRIPSMEIVMESYPTSIANIGKSFENFGGARATFVIQCLIAVTTFLCNICRLNLKGELKKLIKWVMNSGDSGTGKTPAMETVTTVLDG